jgi:hypothetical protein
MAAYGFPDSALLGLVQSNEEDVASIPAGTSTLKPGDLVFSYRGDNVAYPYFADVTKLVLDGDLSASNSTVITVNGIAATAVVYATSHAATMTAIINGITGLAVAGTTVKAVLDSSDANGRTILVLTKGATCVASGAVTGGSARTVTATTGLSGSMFRGVVKYATRVPTTIGGQGVILTGLDVPVVRMADIYAASASGLVKSAIAYITTAGVFGTSGTDVGVRAVDDYDSTGPATKVRLPILPAPMAYGDRF